MHQATPIFLKEMVSESHTKTKPFGEPLSVIRLPADRVRHDNYRGYSGGASCFNVGGLTVIR